MSTTTDIECPRCHRISFGWETDRLCTGCKWVIRPGHVAEPYGYDVLIEVRTGKSINTTEPRHYKGNEATARRRARSVPKFEKVLAVVPLSEAQWLNCYGEGKM